MLFVDLIEIVQSYEHILVLYDMTKRDYIA